MDYWAEVMSEAQKMSAEWIDVNDRLPERAERVLVAVGYMHVCVGIRGTSDGEWYNDYFPGIAINPTHWMPLPKPPKEQGGNTHGKSTENQQPNVK